MQAVPEPGYIDLRTDFSLMKPVTDGFLITDAADDAVYRALTGEKNTYFSDVHERIQGNRKLVDSIVPTAITDHPYLKTISPIIFRHKRIQPISYAVEWPPLMFRDYVLFMIELIAELDKAGLGLGDPSNYNVTFHNGGFLFIDYSAIHRDKTSLLTMRLFIELHINILLMIVKNQGKGYMFLRNHGFRANYKDIVGYLDEDEQADFREAISRSLDKAEKGFIVQCCELLKQYVEKFSAGLVAISDWTGYQDRIYQSTANPSAWTAKQRNVIDLIHRAAPRTMLDLGGNMGWYCIAKSRDLDYAITADIDAGISNKAYEIVTMLKASNVIPVWFNLVSPTLPTYRGAHICAGAIHPYRKGAVERFQCDLVLALAIEHHLALSQGLSFKEIMAQLALYAAKHLIIEFVDRDDRHVIPYLRVNDDFRTEWYTKKRFEEELASVFKVVATAPSETGIRTLYLCEKKCC